MDTMTTMYVFSARTTRLRSPRPHRSRRTKHLMTSGMAEGRAAGFLLCGDDPVWFANGTNSWGICWRSGLDHAGLVDEHGPAHFRRGLLPRLGFLAEPAHHAQTSDMTHCRAPMPRTTATPTATGEDSVNYPYWEPYALNQEQNYAINISYGLLSPLVQRHLHHCPGLRHRRAQATVYSSSTSPRSTATG